jgi:cellulose synthase/poly-beta-1,6-N-acetylglucosamine synthase-like glycosyltransferase
MDDATIAVLAYNEAQSIACCIRTVLIAASRLPAPPQILVVASGCSDDTASVAREALAAYPNACVLEEVAREGKASAVNLAASKASGSVLFLCDADVLVAENSISELWRAFERDRHLSVAYARMASLPGVSRFWTHLGELSIRGLDLYRTLPNAAGVWMVTGYLYAVRLSAWSPIPRGIIAEDVFVGLRTMSHGEPIAYVRSAVVHVRYPQSLRDYVRQKLRNRLGRCQLRSMFVKPESERPQWLGLRLLRTARRQAAPLLTVIALDGVLSAVARLVWSCQPHRPDLWPTIPTSKLQATDLRDLERRTQSGHRLR